MIQSSKHQPGPIFNQNQLYILSGIVFLLFVPLLAMLFTDEVNWSFFDFAIAFILLVGTGFSCEFIFRKITSKFTRIILCGFIILSLLLIWAEVAVGIFDSPFAGN